MDENEEIRFDLTNSIVSMGLTEREVKKIEKLKKEIEEWEELLKTNQVDEKTFLKETKKLNDKINEIVRK